MCCPAVHHFGTKHFLGRCTLILLQFHGAESRRKAMASLYPNHSWGSTGADTYDLFPRGLELSEDVFDLLVSVGVVRPCIECNFINSWIIPKLSPPPQMKATDAYKLSSSIHDVSALIRSKVVVDELAATLRYSCFERSTTMPSTSRWTVVTNEPRSLRN